MTDSTLVFGSPKSFTTIFNISIDAIKDQGALAIYVYLSQKPENWTIRPADVQNRFGIGRDKYQSGIRILKDLGLLETRTVHDKDGKFVNKKTVIHETPITVNRKTRSTVESEESTVNRISRKTVKPYDGKSGPLVSTDYLVIKEVQVTKTCPSEDEPEDDAGKLLMTKTVSEVMFEELWQRYHYKKQRKRALAAWLNITKKITMNEYFIFEKKIIDSFRSKNSENAIGWSNTLFASYLNGELWNDEVTSTQPVQKELDMAARFPATMKQFLSNAWSRIGDMDKETQVILQYGIENGLVKKQENLDKLTQFGFTPRGNEE